MSARDGAGGMPAGEQPPPEDFDAEQYRRESLAKWEAAAPGWARWQMLMRELSEPVSQWMVQALRLQEGETVLDLAAGIGETGFLAAERVGEAGSAIVADQAEAMVAAARERAAELRLGNVEVKQLNAEWIDLPAASVDGVLCRWGFMLMADPGAALKECRRVLRPGGRIALAVWAEAQRNPWATLPGEVVAELSEQDPGVGLGASTATSTGTPGMFSLADRAALQTILLDAGFTEVVVDSLPIPRRHASFEEFWQFTLDISAATHELVMQQPPQRIAAIEAELRARLSRYEDASGVLEIPAQTLVASAEA